MLRHPLENGDPGVEAKRAWLAAQFVHVDTLEKAKSLPCAFNNRAVFYGGKLVAVNPIDAAALEKLRQKSAKENRS